ncbi:hypothetical protein A2W24_00870 [Microgenomates group bacterium RBG_16_45_19]|nr:MAG: hypothetical protein A2W24_00870 [Microgenomates group bacterium RBG_16_45_19]
MTTIDLSVIIPAYNEQTNFKTAVFDEVYQYLKGQFRRFEIIFVDDGSRDDTAQMLKAYCQRRPETKLIPNPHQGKALTVKTGMLKAKGKWRLYTDFDQSTPINQVEKLLPWIRQGYDVVIGSREIKGAKRQAEPLHRHLMGKGFNWVVQIIAVNGFQDTQCGFKLLTEAATMTLFPRLKVTTLPKNDPFTGAFDVELLFLARRAGLKIREVPVNWRHVPSTRVNPVKDSGRMLMEVLKIRWANLTGAYA